MGYCENRPGYPKKACLFNVGTKEYRIPCLQPLLRTRKTASRKGEYYCPFHGMRGTDMKNRRTLKWRKKDGLSKMRKAKRQIQPETARKSEIKKERKA